MGTLYLIPNLLSGNAVKEALPPYVLGIIQKIDHFIVEDVRTARRFLSKAEIHQPIDQLYFYELNEHTPKENIEALLSPLQDNDVGIISEAGVPGVADPGAEVVRLAHRQKIKVVPLIGPSSILMALMASGLNGQSFAFNGYLPIKQNERMERIRFLERRSASEQQTQIFIETPYRNMQLLEDLLKCCKPQTSLCIAADITGQGELIITCTVEQWKTKLPALHKIPTVFLLQA